jgi:hypothetical protein
VSATAEWTGNSVRLEALVRAHGFMRTERPPAIWEAYTDDVRFLPLLGEVIAAALVPGAALSELTLNVANVVVPPDADALADGSTGPLPGEYVAVTVSGPTDFGPDARWPDEALTAGGLLLRLDERLRTAGARFAYIRRLPAAGSLTFFLARLG